MEAENATSKLSSGAKNGNQKGAEAEAPSGKSSPRKKRAAKRSRAKGGSKRTRSPRPYPSTSFVQSLPLAEAIHRVRGRWEGSSFDTLAKDAEVGQRAVQHSHS